MKSDVEKLHKFLLSVKTEANANHYFQLNEQLSRAVALLEGRDAQIVLLKDQLEDYRELLMNKETI